MKIKNGFVLRDVAGSTVVVPLGADHTFKSMLKLNGTGKLLWEALTEGATEEALCALLVSEYEVDGDVAKKDVSLFLESLRRLGVLEE